ncbi:nucleotidyl transferase AbiEii/AbiGii toxin family protein [Novosphingobium colocasiae]
MSIFAHGSKAPAPTPQLYLDRQVTEIVLAAIGLSPSLSQSLVLKGGTLMALAFGSRRVTGDVDFSATVPPDGFDDLLRDELDAKLHAAAIKLGYLDLVCRVQGVKRRPHSDLFENAEFPALELRVGSAERGSKQEAALAEGKASRILFVEVSFRDQVYAFQELNLGEADIAVRAFTLGELIAEKKLRALLQQPIRNRNRRQDVYDIALLIDENPLGDALRVKIFGDVDRKSADRAGSSPRARSIDDPEVARRAQRDWETLRLEVSDLPPFEERFAAVREFYRSLPW